MFEVPPSAVGRLSLQNDGIFGGIAFPLAQMDCYMLFIVRDKRTINSIMQKPINQDNLGQALTLLAGRLDIAQSEPVRLVVCGGSALIAMGLRQRTTKDMDVVALMNAAHELVSPDPLPDFLLTAAGQVARDLGLFEGWLNNDPSRGEGGLFQMGLPAGFVGRLTGKNYGSRLAVHFIGRLDQIHFKLYAAADQRVGTHLNDLKALHPNAAELEAAARWAMTHDVSEGFKMILQELLTQFGHESVAKNI